MTVKTVYSDCVESGDLCPNASAYIDEPEKLATMPTSASHMIAAYAQYDSLQEFFDSEFNSYRGKRTNGDDKMIKCGNGIILQGRLHGCEGHRRKKTVWVVCVNELKQRQNIFAFAPLL